jgi:diketogulonate reductase-like aldo/keto reductase
MELNVKSALPSNSSYLRIQTFHDKIFFITTKILRSLTDIPKGLKDSLSRLGLSYVDLYLIHVPFFDMARCSLSLTEAWAQMESLVDQGLTRFIGVSNYRIEDFEAFLPKARIKPLCNQIEYHPYLQQPALFEYCQKHRICISSYASLAPLNYKKDGPINSVLEKITEKYSRSPAQILLTWVLQKGGIVITTSKQEARLKETFQLIENKDLFKLTEEESKEIEEVGKTIHFRKNFASKF